MDQTPALLLQIAQGIGLAACAGMRAFLPLFVVGIAGRLEWVRLSGSFEWLASTPALVIFGAAVLLELLSDKIPFVDNALDSVQLLVKPVAGTVAAASLMTELSPLQATVLGIVVGGTTADLVHVIKAKVRLVSSAVTAGLGNPALSSAEDGASLLGSMLAIFLPVVLLILLLVAFGTGYWLLRRARSAGSRRIDRPSAA